jgi:hypothetical protein
MAGNRVVNFHRPRSEERLAGPHRVAGSTSASPTTGREKGAPLQTLRVCGAVSRGGTHPADGVPVRRCAGSGGASRPPKPSPATLAGGLRQGRSYGHPSSCGSWLGRGGRALAAGQSPTMDMAGEPQKAWALRRPQALASLRCGKARPRLRTGVLGRDAALGQDHAVSTRSNVSR